MKILVKTFVVLTCISFLSCKKKNGDSLVPFAPPTTPTPTAEIKAVHEKDTLAGNTFINRVHTYYTYNSSGQLTQILKYDSLYDYSTNSILQSSSNEAHHLTYASSKLQNFKHYINNVYLDSMAFVYDTQNRMKTAFSYTINTGVVGINDSIAYTYLNNEIDLYSAINSYSQDYLFDSNVSINKIIRGSGGSYVITSFTNDQYKNPYYSVNLLMTGVASKTNPVSMSEGGVVKSYTYSRNSSNAVVTSHYSSSNGSHGFTTYVY